MTVTQSTFSRGDYGSPRLSIELTNICNLHCEYCLRDEDALYKTAAKHFPLDLLKRVLSEAKETMGVTTISFTGGEPSLHPAFGEILTAVQSAGIKLSFVTNGWNFEKLWPSVLNSRDAITHVAFSLDGITAEEHDRWRGNGSFVRLIKAFSRCKRANVPFVIKVGLRRDTASKLEAFAMFAARLGASALNFSHLLPTSGDVEDKSNLSFEERTLAEQEIAMLARVFKMNIGLDVGYYNTGSNAPCAPLAGTSANIDYRGRLTLCCNLSGFRGIATEEDVAADLNVEAFQAAYARLRDIAEMQMERRRRALEQLSAAGQTADLFTGSPCLLCLQDFKKIPWRNVETSENGSASPSPRLVQISFANS